MTTASVLPRTDATALGATSGDAAARADPSESDDATAVAAIVADAADLARRRGRDDLARRLELVGERVARTETVVCVVGEFKKGKSALINALIGRDVCPVDDDLATMAVTVVRYAPEPGAMVRRREDGELRIEPIAAEDAAGWVAEAESGDRRHGVELVEVGLPIPFLERGIALVDTPGVGGLNAAHAAATLAFLPSADALVFVTDASTELSRPELDFLSAAIKAGPPILIAVTKVDIYPEWRRIVAIDERHLGSVGLTAKPFALSSVLRAHAVARDDAALEIESGYPTFAAALVEDAVGRARSGSLSAAMAQVGPALDQLRDPLTAELTALERPDAAAALAADLSQARNRLAALAEADASWSVRLEDEFTALRTRTAFAFQARMRQFVRETQDEIERIDPARAWPELGQRIQAETAATVRAAFLEATDGAAAIQALIAGHLADEALGLEGDGVPVSFDVSTLWGGGPTFEGRARSGLMASLGVVGGASVGVEMLGMLGTLLGAAVVGPAALGVAAVFGGKQVLSERRRQLADRRQQARAFLASFVEEVRFETDGRLASLLDDVQRQMRARFADRLRELRRTFAETAAGLENAIAVAESATGTRLATLAREVAEIDELQVRTEAAGRSSG